MKFDFPDKDVMVIGDYKIPRPDEGPEPGACWTLMFDRASNALGHGIGEVLTSPKNFHNPLTQKILEKVFFCSFHPFLNLDKRKDGGDYCLPHIYEQKTQNQYVTVGSATIS